MKLVIFLDESRGAANKGRTMQPPSEACLYDKPLLLLVQR